MGGEDCEILVSLKQQPHRKQIRQGWTTQFVGLQRVFKTYTTF